jgi:hypothetical protein
MDHRAFAMRAGQQTFKKRTVLISNFRTAGAPVRLKLRLDLVEQLSTDDCRMFARVDILFVSDLARVQHIGQQLVQGVLLKRLAAFGDASWLSMPSFSIRVRQGLEQRATATDAAGTSRKSVAGEWLPIR